MSRDAIDARRSTRVKETTMHMPTSAGPTGRRTTQPTPGALARRAGRRTSHAGHPGPALESLESRRVLAADLIAVFTNQGSLVAPGEDITFAIEVRNIGDTGAAASTGSLVLSPDATIGDDNDLIFADLPNDPIVAGGSSGGGATLTVPADLTQGLWYLGIIADVLDEIPEDDETNNTAISDNTVVRNVPDLIPLLLLNEPSPLPEPGDTIEVTFSFLNNTDFIAGIHTSRVVLSPDGSFGGPDDVTLFERDFTSIDPFGTPGFVEDLLIPADLPVGTWRLGVVADVNDNLLELDETNNIEATTFDLVIVVEPRPDLVPATDFNALPLPTTPGSTLTVEFTVGNIASALAPASQATVVLTLDQVLGNADDVVLSTLEVAQMGTFGSTFLNPTVTIPADLGPGTWFLGFRADSTGAIDEDDETNNAIISPSAAVTVLSLPNIQVLGGANSTTPILHETKATRPQGTGFGPVQEPGATKSTLFVITNSGNDTLTITSIEPRGQRPQDYSITQLPEFSIAPGATTTFIVQFDPTAFGTRRANIAIFTNDPDLARFTMRIAGRGVPDPALQDIAVTGGTETISDGDRKARNGTGQKFGAAAVAQQVVKVFTITNQGTTLLTFTSPIIRVAGTNPSDFSVLAAPPQTTLAPGASTTFSIRFSPLAIGLRKATIEVLSDDPDEGTFDFRVSALGI